MSEAAFQSKVLKLCDAVGVLAYHTHDSRRSQRGFPDLTLLGARTMLFAELKTDEPDSKLRPEQAMWGDALTDVDMHFQVWRPSMWDTVVVPQIRALGRCPAYAAFKAQQAEVKARAMLASRNERLQRGQ